MFDFQLSNGFYAVPMKPVLFVAEKIPPLFQKKKTVLFQFRARFSSYRLLLYPECFASHIVLRFSSSYSESGRKKRTAERIRQSCYIHRFCFVSGLDKLRFTRIQNTDIAVSAIDINNLPVEVGNNNIGNLARLCPFDFLNGAH